MTIKKIRSVVAYLVNELDKQNIKAERMPMGKHFSTHPARAQEEMIAHAYYLLTVSIPTLLSDKRRLRSRSGHGKIGRHLASAQVLLWTAGMYTLIDLMNQNRTNPN